MDRRPLPGGCPRRVRPADLAANQRPIASSRTDDILFNDPNNGWAVNSNGQILKTTDGGTTWVEQLHDPEVYFRCLGFANANRGWAAR